MAGNTLPSDFNWVTARGSCSLHHVFKELELGVRSDIESAQSLIDPRSSVRLSVATSTGKRFSALRVPDPVMSFTESVDFALEGKSINVYVCGKLTLSAAITLNNEGKCKLKVGEEELEQWQFRRKALEDLFFGS